MQKTFVLDTNVLIQAPQALKSFQNNEVVIPLVVLEELDLHKKDVGEVGANVRASIRMLEQIRKGGDLTEGVLTADGGIVRVEKNCVDVQLPKDLPDHKSDNRILKVCLGLQEKAGGDHPVILVTKDILLRIKAQIVGIEAQDFTAEQVGPENGQYTGRQRLFTDSVHFKEFKKKGVETSQVYTTDENGEKVTPTLFENKFILLVNDTEIKHTQLGRVKGDKIVKLEYQKEEPYGIKPRNVGQYFMQEALMQPAKNAPLVIVKGIAGTSKTFYSLACGLEKVYNQGNGEYRRILICRPNSQFDDDIGFLPGDEQETIAPLMRPILDNLEQLVDSNEEERYKDEAALQGKVGEIFDRGIIQTEALNFIRGRSIVDTWLIIDEAQNMTPLQAKGIITRAGKGTKVIFLGDPNQIDRPYLDEQTNGLSYAAEHMKGSPLCWQVTMDPSECERSALALDASMRL